MQKIFLLAVGIFGLFACTANAAVISFDGGIATTPLTFGDFQFTSTGGTAGTVGIASVPGATGLNGTHAFGFVSSATVTVNYMGPGTFTLNSLDLGRLTTGGPTFFTIGSNVFGPFATLTPTAFGPLFSNLTSLSITATQDSAFDNFDFTINAPAAVPEPASAAFLGLGSLALVVRRMRRRSSVVA